MELIYRDLANYCTQVIDDFELRVKSALSDIDSNRCTLQYADYSLYSDIQNAVYDYCLDNNIEYDSIDIESIIY